jgi:hypothetical protein
MGAKADIGGTTPGDDGIKRHVYAQHIGNRWVFFERPKRRGRDIEWIPMPDPPLTDWLELLDALERGHVRRRYKPDDIAEVRKRILELFPEFRFPKKSDDSND